MIDIKGNFNLNKFIDKIRNFYDAIYEKIVKEKGGLPGDDGEIKEPTEDDILNDKSEFINKCLENFYIFSVMDAEEFTTVSRSLPIFFKNNREIAMVVIDGMHYFENNATGFDEGEDELMDNVPNANDFFLEAMGDDMAGNRKSIQMKKRLPSRNKLDPRIYEKRMVDVALNILKELQKSYKFSFIKMCASLYIKKGAEF